MLVDNKSIVGEERERVNKLFSEAFHWAKEIDRESLINDWIFGPDCVELMVGGELWIINDTKHKEYDDILECNITSAICFWWNKIRDQREQWICDHNLFVYVMELSPLESCKEMQDKIIKRRWFEVGSKASLELHLSMMPACARSSYVIEWIEGNEYGLRVK